MEAVPRLPMYSFELKVSPDRPPTEFSKLKQYIRDLYNEDPETYSTEIRNLETLRAQAVHPVKDVNGCSILKKYYCQLHFLESRFPLGKDGPISFTWRDTYSGIVCPVTDIKYEIVAILYNIGALHSQMGASDDRTSPEGLKMACTHFQCAAWAFQHIKDSYAQPSGVDLSPDLMQFMYQLCLAQAQECILEKSMTDNRKANINARVATQIVDYYNLAQNALIQGGNEDSALVDVVGSKLMKTWKKYVRFKATYYTCVSLLYQGMQSEEQQKMGERVAYFQAALDKLNEAIKLSKGLDQSEAITESLLFTRDVVECKRKAAKSENEFIYHEEVVDVDTLPSIKGASLVKGISFNINDSDISGPDIFARLVPMKAHEASSLYSEEKAKLLRKINGLIDAKDEEVVSYMSCLQLDHLKAHLESDTLPQEVVDRCAALSVKPDAIPNLIAAMDKLNDAYHDVDGMLLEIMELIKTEEKNEKEYQEIMGSRAPSIVATDLTREANKYMEAHKKAAESNETLNRAMSQHVENLRVLQQSLPELQAQLPTLTPLNLEENESLKEVTMLVGKVDEMRKQRAMLASQLRESICSDDITAILVTRSPDNTEQLFEQELKKHEKYVKLIEQNLSAQENILSALTDAYARYAPTRKATADIIKQRELMLSALISSYDAYEDLLAKSSKGMEFYRKLETNLTKLLQRVKGTCRVQQEEREAILAKNNIKASQEIVIPPDNSGTGPKLKDYLQKRKEAQSLGGGYPVGHTNQNWLPGVRPAPVGSEVTQPLVSSSKAQEYSVPVDCYSGVPSNSNQQLYAGYSVAYGQNVPISYHHPVNNLQFPSISDPNLPVDSNPTAPYRPDSRASTSSDHSLSQQQVSQTPIPFTPSPDLKSSPIHTSEHNASVSQPNLTWSNQIHSGIPSQNFGQAHPYQGNYSYPVNCNPVGSQMTNINPAGANIYPYQPSTVPCIDTSYAPQTNKPSSQMTNALVTQPSNVSIIQVNPDSGTEGKSHPPLGSQPTNVQNIQIGGDYNAGQHPNCKPLSDSGSGLTNYYDPSHAKAMNVPSASYSGPYGYNTMTSPYTNYYTSQMYNGNVSSTATDRTRRPSNSTVTTTPQSTCSVYSSPESSQGSYTPVNNNNQVPTTTYTVPASQQFNSNQVCKENFPSSTQPYAVPSLVSPTQTTYDFENSGQSQQSTEQASLNQPTVQNPYASVAQSAVSQVSDAHSYSSPSTAKQSNSYPFGQSQAPYSQYQTYSSISDFSQQGQIRYPGLYLGRRGHAFPSGQTNSNIYDTTLQPYSNYSNQSPATGTQTAIPSASQGTANYSQIQVIPNYQEQPHSYSANFPQAIGSFFQAGGNSPQIPGHFFSVAGNLPQSSGGVNQNVANYVMTAVNLHSSSTNGSPSTRNVPPAVESSPQPPVSVTLAAGNYHQMPASYSQPSSYSHLNQNPVQQIQPNNPQLQTGSMQIPQASNYVPSSHQVGTSYGQTFYNYQGQTYQSGYYLPTQQHQHANTPVSSHSVSNETPSNPSTSLPQQSLTQTSQSESNVDLLAGLDFNVTDAPLQPLPPPSSVSQISESLSNVTMDSKPNSSSPVNGESKPQVEKINDEIIKDEKIPLISSMCIKSEETSSKPARDPFTDADALNLFVQEVDKFEKFVDGLCAKTLSGPTPLDIKWSELQDLQEKDAHKQNISVARCYPMKNRFPDILPYDNSTVELPSTKDDYINASFVKNMCSGCPDFILTQAPLLSTYTDFWTMILEQHVELVICLLSESQMNGEIYWPLSKSEDLMFGQLKVSLQSCNARPFWVERIISVSNSKTSRVIVHLQFTAWPNSWFPESPGPWLQLVGEALSIWRGCRNTESCIVVHCDAGVGRSGLFVTTAVALSEMILSPHIPDMVIIASKLAMWRKNPLRDRDHLKFAYQTILYYCQDILMKRGILSSKGTFEEKRSKGKSHTRHPSQDFLLNSSSHSVSSEERRHSDASSTGSRMSEIDPLNQLDPLWQIKRHS